MPADSFTAAGLEAGAAAVAAEWAVHDGSAYARLVLGAVAPLIAARVVAPRLVKQAELESELVDLRRTYKELEATHAECVRGVLLEADADDAAIAARARAEAVWPGPDGEGGSDG